MVLVTHGHSHTVDTFLQLFSSEHTINNTFLSICLTVLSAEIPRLYETVEAEVMLIASIQIERMSLQPALSISYAFPFLHVTMNLPPQYTVKAERRVSKVVTY